MNQFGPIQKVLMVREKEGRGVESDPCREVFVFVDHDSLEVICRHDGWMISKNEELVTNNSEISRG